MYIVEGLVLGALIVGAAQIMQVESPVQIFGYPAIATLMLILAAFLVFFTGDPEHQRGSQQQVS